MSSSILNSQIISCFPLKLLGICTHSLPIVIGVGIRPPPPHPILLVNFEDPLAGFDVFPFVFIISLYDLPFVNGIPPGISVMLILKPPHIVFPLSVGLTFGVLYILYPLSVRVTLVFPWVYDDNPSLNCLSFIA